MKAALAPVWLGGRARQILAAVILLNLLGSFAALACTPAPGWPHKARLDAKLVAEEMVASAAFVDLVKVEALTPDFEVGTHAPEGWYPLVTDQEEGPKTIQEALKLARGSFEGGARIHYRVIKHLKGLGDENFTIDGEVIEDKFAVRPFKLANLKYFLDQQDYIFWEGPGVCTHPVFAKGGGYTLIFRDADNRLLRAPVSVTFRGRTFSISGPAAIPVSGPSDPWVLLVSSVLTSK